MIVAETNWRAKTDKVILEEAANESFVQGLTDPDRVALQLDLCRRFQYELIFPDGTKPEVPK